MKAVIVLHADLHAQARGTGECRLLERLPYAKRLELEAREPAARRAGLRGIALALSDAARFAAHGAGVEGLCFPQGGKPRLRDGPTFSISHTARRVAVALAAEGELGLDLEDFVIGDGRRDVERMRLERWTATEAVLKAAGQGLRAAADVGVDMAGRRATCAGRCYVLTALAIAPDVVTHLATDGLPTSIEIERVDFDA